MWPDLHEIHRTNDGVIIYVRKGGKSRFNFRVQYRQPGKAIRTPKHIHLIVDLYAKRTGRTALTMRLVDHLIEDVILRVRPSFRNPPAFQVFRPRHASPFRALTNFGEYSAEFLLAVTELIMIQERTNYPEGRLNLDLFRLFRSGADIFSVVGAATFRGR